MNTNRAVIIGMFVFWAIAVALMVAGLISYENQKLIDSLAANGNGQKNGQAVSEEQVKNTSGQGSGSEKELTLSVVSQHSVENDCWMVISGSVYDVTSYIPMHPGGRDILIKYCGENATEAFSSKDKPAAQDHSAFAYALLDKYFVGNIGDMIEDASVSQDVVKEASESSVDGTQATTVVENATSDTSSTQTDTQTTTQTALTISEVATHDSASSCWLIMNSKVYDVTAYIPMHPGGSQRIINYCGKDALAAYNAEGHSSFANNLLNKYYIGDVGSTVTQDQITTTNTNTTESTSVESTIESQFPGATILKTESEDSGVSKVVLRYGGEKYEVLIASDGTILKVEEDD